MVRPRLKAASRGRAAFTYRLPPPGPCHRLQLTGDAHPGKIDSRLAGREHDSAGGCHEPIWISRMKPTADDSKVDIEAEVHNLLEVWADRRNYGALCELWCGYCSLNGLTDGWELFLASLKRLRGTARVQESNGILPAEADTVNKLIGVVGRMLNDR